MPATWSDATEKKLLLEVIAVSNPSVPNSVWARIAAAMGETYTGEACRQKYQGIKRTLKPSTDGGPTPTNTPTKTTKSTKPTKSLKRKATKDAATHEDDDEASTLFGPHSKSTSFKKKMKKENDDENGIHAEVFKAEDAGAGAEGGVDLERDDLYDDAI